MGDKPNKVPPFPPLYEMKSLRSGQKTPKLSYAKGTEYISTKRKFWHLFNVSVLVLFKTIMVFLNNDIVNVILLELHKLSA